MINLQYIFFHANPLRLLLLKMTMMWGVWLTQADTVAFIRWQNFNAAGTCIECSRCIWACWL